jgi:hypothetical protein
VSTILSIFTQPPQLCFGKNIAVVSWREQVLVVVGVTGGGAMSAAAAAAGRRCAAATLCIVNTRKNNVQNNTLDRDAAPSRSIVTPRRHARS